MKKRDKQVIEALDNMTEDEIYAKHMFVEDNMPICKNYQDSIKVGGDIENLRGQVEQIFWECVVLCEDMDQFEHYFHKTVSLEIPVYQATHNPLIKMPTDLARYSRSLYAIKQRFEDETDRKPSIESLKNYEPFQDLVTRSGISMKRFVDLYHIQEGHLSLDYVLSEDDDSAITQGDLVEDPYNFEDAIDSKLDLEAFLEQLPSDHADTMRMWIDLYTVSETAQKLGVSDVSVRKWRKKYIPRIQELRHNAAG